MAISLDLYVIIDWHILSDNNPNIHKEEAKAFFTEMAIEYKNVNEELIVENVYNNALKFYKIPD